MVININLRRPDSRVKKILRSNTITAENQPPRLKISRKSQRSSKQIAGFQGVSPKSNKSYEIESLTDLDSGAFSGSDHVTSPFIRPKNPDLPSLMRTKISIAQLFASGQKTPIAKPQKMERLSSFSDCSIDSTFFIETKKPAVKVGTLL